MVREQLGGRVNSALRCEVQMFEDASSVPIAGGDNHISWVEQG